MISDVEHLSSCAFWPSVHLWRNVCLDLLPIFGLGCLFWWYWASWAVCIFWRLILCWSHHLQIFSPNLEVPFVLFIVSFAVHKILSLRRSHLFIFVFISIFFWETKKILVWFMAESGLPIFSSRFTVSHLTFGYSIYFELIFVYHVKQWSNFIYM